MDINEAITKIANYLDSSVNKNQINHQIDFSKIHTYHFENYKVVFKELTWKEGLTIDAESFKKNDKNYYFISEKEKRLIVQKCIIQILDFNDKNIDFTFESLSFDFVEKFWFHYQSYLHLSASEVNDMYNCAKKYFDPTYNESFPVFPLIIEVDYMTKGIVSLSKKEFEELTMREFEAIQLILAVKNGG